MAAAELKMHDDKDAAQGVADQRNVLALLEQALERPEAEREAFLRQHADGATLDHLLGMLDLAGKATEVLFAKPQQTIRSAMSDRSGETIGAFRLEALIAEGGMGQVYRATRSDGVLDQVVAIKIIRPLVTNPDTVRRFEIERQLLANLSHANIATLHDGGTTEDGLPYLVMEFIEGQPLDAYLQQSDLPFERRLALFEQIARGVSHAHKHLIVHRDLKPTNVLVDDEGRVKLLDFGIAQSLTDAGQEQADRQARMMTPSYASPEQYRGDPLTVATDIYSLGLLLYECITGRAYRNLSGSTEREISEELLTQESPPASKRAAEHQKRLRGDLDAIIGKCLAFAPEARYASVTELLADIANFRNGMPVSPRAESAAYRAQRFARRHWVWVAASFLAVLSLGAGLFVAAQQALEAQRQRDIAVRETHTAADSVQFLKNLLFSAHPWEGSEQRETVEDVLAHAERELENAFVDRPDSRAYLLAAMAEIYVGRGNVDKAKRFANEAVTLAMGSEKVSPRNIANAHRTQGAALMEAGDYDAAESSYRQALRDLPAEGYDNLALRASTHNDLGAVYQWKGLYEEATIQLLAAKAIYESGVTDQPLAHASSNANLGLAYLELGDLERAEQNFEQAENLLELGNASNAQRAMNAGNRATVLMRLRRFDDSVALLRRALPLLRQSLGQDHPESFIMDTTIGSGLYQAGRIDEGLTHMKVVVEQAEQVLDPSHPILAYAHIIASALHCNGGEAERGIELADRALAARIAVLGPDHWTIQTTRSILGECMMLAGRPDDSRPLLESSYHSLLETFGAQDERVIKAQERLEQLTSAR